jgi:dihydropteroate synthase
MDKNTSFLENHSLNLHGKLMEIDKALIMGILNLSEDSFFDGGLYTSEKKALERCEQILKEGGNIIDIGAISTRPGAKEQSQIAEEQLILPIFKSIRKQFPDAVLSVDTWRSSIAAKVLDLGADIINDISGGQFDNKMHETVANYNAAYVLMHTSAKPNEMQEHTEYKDLVTDIAYYFSERISLAKEKGIKDIIIDPGFGFGKTIEQNYLLLKNLEHFQLFGFPILVGISRKSMIYKLLKTSPEKVLNGTTALHSIALMKKATILRVHDVKEAAECIQLMDALSIV